METGWYYLNSRYYDPQARRFLNADDPSIPSDQATIFGGLNLYSYCLNNTIIYKQCLTAGGSAIVPPNPIGDVYVGSWSESTSLRSNPSAPGWLQIAIGAIPDAILGAKYLFAHGMHKKFMYSTKTRYMHPVMDGTWRWTSKTRSGFTNLGNLSTGAFKQILTGDSKAGFGALAKSFGNTVGLNALVNFGFNFYENNWQIDSAMLMDTAIDTAIGVGSYYMAAGTMSLITSGAVALGFAVPGIIVVAGVVLLSIGFEWLIREIIGYHN